MLRATALSIILPAVDNDSLKISVSGSVGTTDVSRFDGDFVVLRAHGVDVFVTARAGLANELPDDPDLLAGANPGRMIPADTEITVFFPQAAQGRTWRLKHIASGAGSLTAHKASP